MTVTEAQETIADRLRWQADWCERLGSPLYAAILEAAAADVERGGATWELLAGREQEPARSFLALRLLGAVHRLVLMGRSPELAAFYPSAGGRVDLDAAPATFVETLEARASEVGAHLDRPVQTNEVSRCAGLLGGFLTVARETGMPLELHEIGASAGLNLRFDRYFYAAGDESWGDPASPVRLTNAFDSTPPPFDSELTVAQRRGCDRSPLDPRAQEDRLTLMSFVWPDQSRRFELLRGALEVAAGDRVEVERAGAADWAEQVLESERPGVATMIFHSIVLQYLSTEEAERLHAAILAAGRRATPEAPFGWLYMEPGQGQAEVRLQLWPGGTERLLAKAGFHASPVSWLG